jgi:hypothetical protein
MARISPEKDCLFRQPLSRIVTRALLISALQVGGRNRQICGKLSVPALILNALAKLSGTVVHCAAGLMVSTILLKPAAIPSRLPAPWAFSRTYVRQLRPPSIGALAFY